MKEAWPWLALLGLGAFHGINPGMGWLFAVALGLQEQRRSAVWSALPPIAVGHALSVGLVVALVVVIRASISYEVLRWVAAAVLIGFGIYRLVRTRHPRWVGMRVGFRDLTLWSFLMASAHGAGLMLVPVSSCWTCFPKSRTWKWRDHYRVRSWNLGSRPTLGSQLSHCPYSRDPSRDDRRYWMRICAAGLILIAPGLSHLLSSASSRALNANSGDRAS